MLERMRAGAKSWVAQALIAALVVSFAIWGMGDITRGFSSRAATVGDEAVEAGAYLRALRRAQQQFGVEPAQTRELGLDRYVLAQLVREAAFADAAGRLGVSAPDAALSRAVRADPSFQSAGRFDPLLYETITRRAFGGVAVYEDELRGRLAGQLVAGAAGQGARAPAGAAAAIARYLEERRGFDLFALPLDAAPVPDTPDDAALQTYLDANAARFATPERRSASWLRIDPARLAESLEIPEEEIRAAYDAAGERYVMPERRAVDQIVYPDRAEAEAARARLDAGEADFDALLAARGLSRDDAALGRIKPGDLRDARGEAAFALAAPGVAGPAETAAGWALLDITEILPGMVTPYADAREALRHEIATARVAPDADRLVERVEDLRAEGATLEEIAAELGLHFASAEGLSAQGAQGDEVVDGITVTPDFLTELFAAGLGEERAPQRSSLGGWYVLRLDDAAPSRTPALDEVRDRVLADWRLSERRKALLAMAQEAAGRIAGGADAASVAGGFGASLETLAPLRRGDPEPRLGADARAALFAAEPGGAAATLLGDAAHVAVLRAVEQPAEIEAQRAAIRAELDAAAQQDQLEYLGRALEAESGAAVNQSVVDAAISQAGG